MKVIYLSYENYIDRFFFFFFGVVLYFFHFFEPQTYENQKNRKTERIPKTIRILTKWTKQCHIVLLV